MDKYGIVIYCVSGGVVAVIVIVVVVVRCRKRPVSEPDQVADERGVGNGDVAKVMRYKRAVLVLR